MKRHDFWINSWGEYARPGGQASRRPRPPVGYLAAVGFVSHWVVIGKEHFRSDRHIVDGVVDFDIAGGAQDRDDDASSSSTSEVPVQDCSRFLFGFSHRSPTNSRGRDPMSPVKFDTTLCEKTNVHVGRCELVDEQLSANCVFLPWFDDDHPNGSWREQFCLSVDWKNRATGLGERALPNATEGQQGFLGLCGPFISAGRGAEAPPASEEARRFVLIFLVTTNDAFDGSRADSDSSAGDHHAPQHTGPLRRVPSP